MKIDVAAANSNSDLLCISVKSAPFPWAFDDIIFPSMRSSPPAWRGLAFQKAQWNLQWISEQGASSSIISLVHLSSRDLSIFVSLIAAVGEKTMKPVAIIGMK